MFSFLEKGIYYPCFYRKHIKFDTDRTNELLGIPAREKRAKESERAGSMKLKTIRKKEH
jgi:hypothetical protein